MTLKNGVPLEFEDICELHNMYLELAVELNSIRSRSNFDIETKSDGSPVTKGDKLAHQTLTTFLNSRLEKFSILSEEMVDPEVAIPSERTIFVDPIDGTKHFIEKKNPYFSLIGIAIDGIPMQGFHFRADNGELIYNASEGAFLRNRNGVVNKLSVSKTAANLLSMKRFSEEDRDYFKSKGFTRERYQYNHLEMIHPLFSDSIGMISRRATWFWDLCAPAAIMRSAGFRFVMFNKNNQEITFNHAPIKCDWWACVHPDKYQLIDYFL